MLAREVAAYGAGYDLLARGAWAEARLAFEAALEGGTRAPLLEGLGLAAWWLDLADLVFSSRERAYSLYLEDGDRPGAARVAVWLAWDSWAFRGENAVANGWLQRARRHLDGLPDLPERAWLELREGALALLEEGDPDRADAHAIEGMRVARAAGSTDLEMLGRAIRGLGLVMAGAVADGMSLLDEVNTAVVAGEMKDLVAIGLSCCYLISACDRVRDYDRALQWCARLKEFCARWGLRPLFAVCRTQYASLCLWRGTWLEAEHELRAATDELAASRPAMTADGLVRLAELRRRQGRLVEATAMFQNCGSHPLAALGLAELAFDRGDLRSAADQAERYLRRVLAHNRPDRAAGLDLLVRARAALGDIEGAGTAVAELAAIAALVGTAPLQAAAKVASAQVALADQQPDEARRDLEDAIDLFLRSGAPYELARTRLDLARALAAGGRLDAAAGEVRRAMDTLTELGASLEVGRAKTLLSRFSGSAGQEPASSHATALGLTKREMEILRLVAEGLSNQVIAERLFVSDHTVHRHVANIFSKLSVSSRAAAVAQAARRGLL